jgi:putative ABC transport system ATP-binding protein
MAAEAGASAAAVEAIDVTRVYAAAGGSVRGVSSVSLNVDRGEVVAVMGPSGSGKSTLLFLLAGLDRPDEGSVRVSGVDWATLEDDARARFRRHNCGFIVQGSSLLPQATAAENVEVPLLLDGVDLAARRRRVAEALERVELAEHSAKLPDQLSGGQQQRVAIARALVGEPAVVLADEPTANLDSETAQAVSRLLVSVAPELGAAVVLVTHDPAVGRHAHRTVQLHSGQLDSNTATGGGPP